MTAYCVIHSYRTLPNNGLGKIPGVNILKGYRHKLGPHPWKKKKKNRVHLVANVFLIYNRVKNGHLPPFLHAPIQTPTAYSQWSQRLTPLTLVKESLTMCFRLT